MKSHVYAAVVSASLLVTLGPTLSAAGASPGAGVSSATSETRGVPNNSLTASQRATVRDVLVKEGYTSAAAANIANDYKRAIMVPTGTSHEVASGKGGPGGVRPTNSNSGVAPYSLGSCSGPAGWVYRITYINNVVGAHFAYVKLLTNFNYNGTRVTCTGSSRSWYIYSWAALTVWWEGWQDSITEYFYTSGGHVNGGALTSTEGKFSHCVVGLACDGSRYPYAETRVYWNGTWLTGGSVGESW